MATDLPLGQQNVDERPLVMGELHTRDGRKSINVSKSRGLEAVLHNHYGLENGAKLKKIDEQKNVFTVLSPTNVKYKIRKVVKMNATRPGDRVGDTKHELAIYNMLVRIPGHEKHIAHFFEGHEHEGYVIIDFRYVPGENFDTLLKGSEEKEGYLNKAEYDYVAADRRNPQKAGEVEPAFAGLNGFTKAHIPHLRLVPPPIRKNDKLREFYRIFIGTAESLYWLAANRFVHTDVKLDNIFVADDGRVFLLDFAKAKEPLSVHPLSRSNDTIGFKEEMLRLLSFTGTPPDILTELEGVRTFPPLKYFTDTIAILKKADAMEADAGAKSGGRRRTRRHRRRRRSTRRKN